MDDTESEALTAGESTSARLVIFNVSVLVLVVGNYYTYVSCDLYMSAHGSPPNNRVGIYHDNKF